MDERELLAAKRRAQRFEQLFQLIGDGFAEYITLTESCLLAAAGGEEETSSSSSSSSNSHGQKPSPQLPLPSPTSAAATADPSGNSEKVEEKVVLPVHSTGAGFHLQMPMEECHLLVENHRLYKLHAQRLAKLDANYAKWRLKLDRATDRLFGPNSSSGLYQQRSTSTSRLCLSRFAPPLLFCRCPSPHQRKQKRSQQQPTSTLYRPQSSQSLQHLGQKAEEIKQGPSSRKISQADRPKSRSALNLSARDLEREERESVRVVAADEDSEESPARTVLTAMAAIESEVAGMVGRIQFQVNAIVGFARLCTGDLFEVSIKHGHQRWRTRGKTQPDKSQKWDQQPPSVTFNVLAHVPVHVKVLEVGFLRSRCLNERQFDPAKFASAQPQLVTMNLNSVGSIKLRLVATWLPLLSAKPPPMPPQLIAQQRMAMMAHQQQQNGRPHGHDPAAAFVPNGGAKLRQHQSQLVHRSNQSSSSSNPWACSPQAGLPPKVPPKRNQSLGAEFPPPAVVDDGSPVKVCLRDKKRQREQRQQAGLSVAASLGSGLSREASRADKDRWRCSSTTLLDEVYKDLAKSIPTIDDLSALHPKSGSLGGGGGGSLGPANSAFSDASAEASQQQQQQQGTTTSASDARGPKTTAKRIFSFVKRAEKAADEAEQRQRRREEWRKSISLGQIGFGSGNNDGEENADHLGNREEAEVNDGARSGARPLEEEPAESASKSNGRNAEDKSDGGGQRLSFGSGSARRVRLSNLKKGRSCEASAPPNGQSHQQNGGGSAVAAEGALAASSSSAASSCSSASLDQSSGKSQLDSALKTLDSLLARIERLRALLAKLRSSEFAELVGFEAAMLNWEACLKLNRSGIICQLDGLISNGQQNPNAGTRRGQNQLRQQRLLANGAGNRNSALFLAGSQHSPSTASDETDESGGASREAAVNGGHLLLDHISENDSGIDSLRQYHSPYSSQNGTTGSAGSSANLKMKDRRKSIGTMLDLVLHNGRPAAGGHHTPAQLAATGGAEMDQCLHFHLARAERALQEICDVQDSPFEYTLTKMLCRMESIETIALESMLGLMQDWLDQCQPNPQNVLLQLGLQFQLQQCWQSACHRLDAFLFAPVCRLREQLRPLCEPIVRSRYPKLVDKVLDSLSRLLSDGSNPSENNQQQQISVFQFVALFRNKQFPAFIENLSHEAWISTSLQSGQPSAVRDVMDRLRNVPVVPPLDSLRHIGLCLALQPPNLTAPIEKYLRKASAELAMDLAACFVCLLEHEEDHSRAGACRALAILRQENSLRCLDFLSRSDSSAQVRAEAQKASAHIRRAIRAAQQEITKI